MNRISDFFSYLNSLPTDQLEKIGTPIAILSDEERESLSNDFLLGVSMALKQYQGLQRQQKKDKLATILISPLRVTMVTQTYEMMITAFDKHLYLNTTTAVGYFTPTYIFKQMDRHVDLFKDLLKEKFIRIQPYEMDEFRQPYALGLSQLLLNVLPDLIPRIIQTELYHEILCEETVIVLFGFYLDKAIPVFSLTKEKS